MDEDTQATAISGHVVDGRHFVNAFADFDELTPRQVEEVNAHVSSRIDAEIPRLVRELRPKVSAIAEASDPRYSTEDFSLYLGAGGLALALWSAAEYLEHERANDELAAACSEDSLRALRLALDLTEGADPRAVGFGFYCGAPGVHALAAMMHGDRDPSSMVPHARRVLACLEEALKTPETELLYGRAGYLYALLVIRRHMVRAWRPPQLNAALRPLFDSLLTDGTKQAAVLDLLHAGDPLARSPLAYRFPHDGGATYFGAAHGLAGVLYVLCHMPDRCHEARSRRLVTGALDFLLSIQGEDGNFPTAIENRDPLVHWCHGAPGIIPTLCKAYEVFGESRYLDAARRAADCVWVHGLLRKGLGVCHGIAGSALSQLNVYRTTGDPRYRYRALRMCEATWTPSVLQGIREAHDRQRYRQGVPDFPYSLMEGDAGLLYAYVTIRGADRSSFPGYDAAV